MILSAAVIAGGGGSGPAPYVAPAVNFDGETKLTINSLASTNNGKFTFAGWFKLAFDPETDTPFLWVIDPETNFYGWFSSISNSGDPTLDAAFSYPGGQVDLKVVPSSLAIGAWTFMLLSVDFTGEAPAGKVYFDDVDVTHLTDNGGYAPFSILTNTLPFWFGTDGIASDYIIGDVADVRFMMGTSLLDGGGDIPLATRRLFIDGDGKPVDPATATAELGAPTILWSGDSASFATNQGTGGSFTTTGALTNASTSPSD